MPIRSSKLCQAPTRSSNSPCVCSFVTADSGKGISTLQLESPWLNRLRALSKVGAISDERFRHALLRHTTLW